MRELNVSEQDIVFGGMAPAGVCLLGAVGGVSSYANEAGQVTVGGLTISAVGGCATALAGGVWGLGTFAYGTGFLSQQAAKAVSPSRTDVQNGYIDAGDQCRPLPGSTFGAFQELTNPAKRYGY
jgi:hypothetical protein